MARLSNRLWNISILILYKMLTGHFDLWAFFALFTMAILRQ